MNNNDERDYEEENANRNVMMDEDTEYDPDLFGDSWKADTIILPSSNDPDAWWIY